jgi:hypothetical protein
LLVISFLYHEPFGFFKTSKALVGTQLDLHEKKLDYLKNTSHDLPLMEEVSFRTETDEWDIRRQEYAVRLDFNTKRERSSQKSYHQSTILAADSNRGMLIQNSLEDKYALWIEYFFYQKEKDIRQQELLILKDKFNVIGILAKTTGKYDLADLIRIENDMDNMESGIQKLELRMKELEMIVEDDLSTSSTITLDVANFIMLSNVKNMLDSLSNDASANPQLDIIEGDMAMNIAELDLEKAKNKKLLDFVQMKYAGDGSNTPYGREWSVGLALNIPIKNSDILDIREIELKQLEIQNDWDIAKLELEKRIQDRRRKLNSLFQQHELLLQQQAEHEQNYSLDYYTKTGTDPMVALKIKETQLEKQRDILDVEADIYFYYLDLLDYSGKLVTIPYVNYLTNTLERF